MNTRLKGPLLPTGLPASPDSLALRADCLTRRFGGLTAVDSVSLEVAPQTIVGVIGPNGAGKTTLLNLLSGAVAPNSGKVLLAGRDLTKLGPTDRASAGLRRTFQNIRLFGSMTVLENVLVGQHAQTKGWLAGGILRWSAVGRAEKDATDRALTLLEDLNLVTKAHHVASSLSYGDQRRLELVRALSASPSVLLLDEPAAGLNSAEKKVAAELISSLPERFGLSVVLVEHDMELVSNTCTYLTVLNYGQLLAEGTPNEVLRDTRVVEAYLGTGGKRS